MSVNSERTPVSHAFVEKNIIQYMRPHGALDHCSCENAILTLDYGFLLRFYTRSARNTVWASFIEMYFFLKLCPSYWIRYFEFSKSECRFVITEGCQTVWERKLFVFFLIFARSTNVCNVFPDGAVCRQITQVLKSRMYQNPEFRISDLHKIRNLILPNY